MTALSTRTRWHYQGDVNIEHGGMFYDLSTMAAELYVSVVRVTPCTDAGGPDNCFWVEKLTVNVDAGWHDALQGVGTTVSQRRAHRALHGMAAAERTEAALACVGYDSPEMLADYDKQDMTTRMHIVVYALVSYGWYDTESTELIQIGPKQANYHKTNGEFMPVKVLRAGSNLRNYVRKQCG